MSRRMELAYVAMLPIALVAVLILKLLDLTESGVAAGVILLGLTFAAFWILDPPEIGWNRRAGKARRQS